MCIVLWGALGRGSSVAVSGLVYVFVCRGLGCRDVFWGVSLVAFVVLLVLFLFW